MPHEWMACLVSFNSNFMQRLLLSDCMYNPYTCVIIGGNRKSLTALSREWKRICIYLSFTEICQHLIGELIRLWNQLTSSVAENTCHLAEGVAMTYITAKVPWWNATKSLVCLFKIGYKQEKKNREEVDLLFAYPIRSLCRLRKMWRMQKEKIPHEHNSMPELSGGAKRCAAAYSN